MWLFWIAVGILVAVLWILVGSIGLCPSCGVRFPKHFGYPYKTYDHCPHCGWKSRG